MNKEVTKYCLDALLNAGADKAQCSFKKINKHEFNVETGNLNLLRTNFDRSLSLKAFLKNKIGEITTNQYDKDSIDKTVKKVIEIAKTSKADPANEIAEKQPAKNFRSGPLKPDIDKMYERTSEFLYYAKKKYPYTLLEQLIMDFTLTEACFQNSNGVEFTTKKGIYNFELMFTTKKGKKTSSFNYSGISTKTLDKKLKNYAAIDALLRESTEQIDTKAFPGKIKGDIIITPDCMGIIIYYLTKYLRDYALISKSSIYKDKLNKKIASDSFALHSKPVSNEIDDGYFITGDGFEAKNSTIIDRGILKTFLLTLYGANKTGKPRAINSGGCYVIEPGNIGFGDMVKTVKEGLLLCRFSGGNPSDNGDFSGVAKNSYYIKDGKIQYPLTETMLSGNIGELFNSIINISKERLDFGSAIYPWIKFGNVAIYGK